MRVTPNELAVEVESVIRSCQDRVGPDSIGAQQYYVPGQPQKFETMSLEGLIEYAQEELRDQINYAVMFDIRLRRLREAIAARLAEEAVPSG